MRKKMAVVGLAALLTLGPGAQAFAQGSQQQPGGSGTGTTTQTNQARNDDGFPWGLLGLLGLGGLAGLRRREHEEPRADRMSTGAGTQSRVG